MKRCVLAIMLVGCVGAVWAVDSDNAGFKPILEPGKSWVWSVAADANAEVAGYDYMKVARDTVVDGKQAFVIEVDELNRESLVTGSGPERITSTRVYAEEGGVLYRHDKDPQGNGRFYPWIDMNLCKDDVINITLQDIDITEGVEKVAGDETITVGGVDRKKITLRPGWIWVEGIGSNKPEYLTIYPEPGSLGMVTSWLAACYMGEECIFTAEDFDISAGITDAIADEADSAELFDLQGRPVDKPVKGRLYVRKGAVVLW